MTVRSHKGDFILNILFIASIDWSWASNIFVFIFHKWANILVKIFLPFVIQRWWLYMKSKCPDLKQLYSKNQFRPYFDFISTRSANGRNSFDFMYSGGVNTKMDKALI